MPTDPSRKNPSPRGLIFPEDFQAAIFDMDGLLIDSEPLWRRAEMAAFARVGVALTDDRCKETMGMRLDAMVAHWRARFSWRDLSDEEMGADILRRVTALIAAEGKALPGVHEVIGALRAMGVPLGLASSSPMALIEAVVARLGLRDAFPVLCTAVDEPRGKPDPAVYLTAARRLGVAPKMCLVFEDSPAGVLAGVRAGMRVVAVPSGSDPALLKEAEFLWAGLGEHPW
ncbi:2-deoxyglucose-6-phosphatase [bacterium DOLZORAL124_64_63]|nr:MAG: 2-deoxyglucose-6-phosphatase [bacterium DOLZORAL124_64_63]